MIDLEKIIYDITQVCIIEKQCYCCGCPVSSFLILSARRSSPTAGVSRAFTTVDQVYGCVAEF